MNKFYIVIDETTNQLIDVTCGMINSVDSARKHHETTKNQIVIYYGKIVGELKKEELEI